MSIKCKLSESVNAVEPAVFAKNAEDSTVTIALPNLLFDEQNNSWYNIKIVTTSDKSTFTEQEINTIRKTYIAAFSAIQEKNTEASSTLTPDRITFNSRQSQTDIAIQETQESIQASDVNILNSEGKTVQNLMVEIQWIAGTIFPDETTSSSSSLDETASLSSSYETTSSLSSSDKTASISSKESVHSALVSPRISVTPISSNAPDPVVSKPKYTGFRRAERLSEYLNAISKYANKFDEYLTPHTAEKRNPLKCGLYKLLKGIDDDESKEMKKIMQVWLDHLAEYWKSHEDYILNQAQPIPSTKVASLEEFSHIWLLKLLKLSQDKFNVINAKKLESFIKHLVLTEVDPSSVN